MTSAPPRPVVVRVRVNSAAPRRGASGRRKPARGRRAPARRSTARRPGGRKRKAGRRSRTYDLSRWWPALLVAAAVLVGVAWDSRGGSLPDSPGLCTLPSSSVTVTPEQAANAAVITQVGRDRGLPERAVVIALATALQESGLRNLDYGDRDSLGLFQQRPSSGWGSPAQVQDPVYAAGKFYDGLVQVPGWETGRLTEIAQSVQRSAFPEAYQKHEPLATDLAAALGPDGSSTLSCP